jgi:hypothetical protein
MQSRQLSRDRLSCGKETGLVAREVRVEGEVCTSSLNSEVK